MMLRNVSPENKSIAPQSPVLDYGPLKSPTLDPPLFSNDLNSRLYRSRECFCAAIVLCYFFINATFSFSSEVNAINLKQDLRQAPVIISYRGGRRSNMGRRPTFYSLRRGNKNKDFKGNIVKILLKCWKGGQKSSHWGWQSSQLQCRSQARKNGEGWRQEGHPAVKHMPKLHDQYDYKCFDKC